MNVLRRLKALVPKPMRSQFHRVVALLASARFGHPSRHLVVIGVTGTDGKTTTASLIADVLQSSGHPVGLSTSAIFQVGDRRWTNESHLTMPGRFALQRLLRQMVDAGCRYAVVEVSSEGLAQYRHSGIDFDVAVVTNVTPEHIEAHGSFEAYRAAKGMLFRSIIRGGDKRFDGRTIPKVTVVNLDDPSHEYFLKFWAEAHYGTALQPHAHPDQVAEGKLTMLIPTTLETRDDGNAFNLDGHQLSVPLPGRYNASNALQAVAVGLALGLDWGRIATGLRRARPIPGRGEEIVSDRGWRVTVDYALTPNALDRFYASLHERGARRIIGVFGAAGGGRDTWKRPELGKIAAKHCDRIILTTDDPYDEDPAAIAVAILAGVPETERGNVETVLDRRQAIKRAMELAQPGDVIALTGMGSETSMMVKGQQVPWNDVQVVREEMGHG